MPDAVGASDKASLHSAAEELQSQFPTMFSASTKCRVPHLNFDTLRDDIYRSKVMARNELKTKDELITWLHAQNAGLPGLQSASWEKRAASTASFKKALAKANANSFYLGLDKSWLD